MVAGANLLPSNDSASLTEWRSDIELIIGCTYKFKVFLDSWRLSLYIY